MATTERIDYAERNINRRLPEGATVIREDLIGTPSGNPTSDVIWSFRQHIIDEAPRFVIAKLDTGPRPREHNARRVYAYGPLKESEYLRDIGVMAASSTFFMDAYLVAEGDGKVAVDIKVPEHHRTVEQVMGAAVQLILIDDPR